MRIRTLFISCIGYICAFWILLTLRTRIVPMQVVNIIPKGQSTNRTTGAAETFTTGTHFRTQFPVDLVYTWVNGTDRKHQENLQRLIQDLIRNKSHTATRARNLKTNRFADNDALRYSLRSVEKYANWIRHVFIVTNGQVPRWLDIQNPRVTLITHEEIFDDPEDLPTFCSHAIEHNIYKIKGLSERFLYMNDDFFFGQNVSLEDFYTEEHGTKIVLSSWTALKVCGDHCSSSLIRNGVCDAGCNYDHCAWDGGDCDSVPEELRPPDDEKSHCDYTTSIFFTNALYNKAFGSRTRNIPAHSPFFITKPIFKDMVKSFPNEVKATVQHKVRSPLDFQYEFSYVYFLMESKNSSYRFEQIPSSPVYSFVIILADERKTKEYLETIRKTKKKFICINDDIDYSKTHEAKISVDLLHDFYQSMFPKPSSFEIRS